MDWTDEEIDSVMQAENQAAPLNTLQNAPDAANNPQDSVTNTNKKSLTGGETIPGAMGAEANQAVMK